MTRRQSYSVVIPLFNKEGTIDRTIDSILSQDHDVEVVIVNDGSTDGGPKSVEARRDPRIKLLHQTNQGISSARNNGIENAKHELIGLLDADDEYLPNFLDLIDELVERYPSAGAYTTAFRYVFTDKAYDSTHPKIKRPFIGTPDYFYLAGVEKYFCASSIVLRKSAITDVGGFFPSWGYGEDIDAWGRLALKYPIAHHTDVGANYIRCGDIHPSMSHRFVLEPCIDFALEALKDESRADKRSLRSYVNNYLCEYARLCVIDGRGKEARATLARRPGNEEYGRILALYMLSYCPPAVVNSARHMRRRFVEGRN
jgi:glycosyltransferase involved in cell wall biosynthesis